MMAETILNLESCLFALCDFFARAVCMKPVALKSLCCFWSGQGILCDLVTGEERRFAHPEGIPSGHVACTVEMTSVSQPCKLHCPAYV